MSGCSDVEDYEEEEELPKRQSQLEIAFGKARAVIHGTHHDCLDFQSLLGNEAIDLGLGFVYEYCSVPAVRSGNGGYNTLDACIAA